MKIFEFDSNSLGMGEVVSSWSRDYNILAVCGESRVVKIFDRQGNNKIEMPLKNTAKVIALEWDMDSESVAILQVRYLNFRKRTQLLSGRLERRVLQKLTCLLKKI